MKYFLVTGLVLGTVFSLGCAKQPDAVAAAQFDDSAYLQMSCEKLKQEEVMCEADVGNLSAEQQTCADNDTAGVILLGLPIGSMSGNDPEAELSIAKGRLNAIKSAQAKKGCT